MTTSASSHLGGGFNLHVKEAAKLQSKYKRNLTVTVTQSTPVPSSQRLFLPPCPLPPVPSGLQACLRTWSSGLWRWMSSKLSPWPVIMPRILSTVAFVLQSQKRAPCVMLFFSCLSSVQSGPLDPLCVWPSQGTVREVLEWLMCPDTLHGFIHIQ